jgi:hypothetical protein
MQNEQYMGYQLWGHAIRELRKASDPPSFAASGSVTKDGKFVAASGIVSSAETEEDAQLLGLE